MRTAILLLVSLTCTGCMSDVAHRHYEPSRPSRSPHEVEVLFSRPMRPFRVVADFQARRATVEYMREEAAGVGADAIIVARVGGSVRSASLTTTKPDGFVEESHNIYGHLTGTAIIYE